MGVIRNINKKSDFKVLFTIPDGCVGVPFKWIFNVGRSRYFAERSKDGDCVNCEMIDDNHVLVIFNSHNFPIGKLFVEYHFYFFDESFHDHTHNYISNEFTDIELVDGKTDDEDVIISSAVMVNVVRGYSAFELARQHGWQGTFEEWLAMGGYSQEVLNIIQRDLLINIENVARELDSKVDEAKRILEGQIGNLANETSRSINDAKSELDGKIDTAKTELSGNIDSAKNELDGKIGTLRSDLTNASNQLSKEITDKEKALNDRCDAIQKGITDNVNPLLLTEAQQNWLIKQMQGDKQSEADEKFTLTTSVVGDLVYYNDTTEDAAINAVVKVILGFNGESNLYADNIPTGWVKGGGSYTYALNAAKVSAPATRFDYTLPLDYPEYGGIKVSKTSTAKSISIVNAAYYGIAKTNDINQINAVIKTLTRITGKLSTTTSFSNEGAGDGYLWIVSKGSSRATQLGLSIMESPEQKTFVSPRNAAISLAGYNIYISRQSAASGGSFDSVTLDINN